MLPYLLEAAEERGESAFVIAWKGTEETITPQLRKRVKRIVKDKLWPQTCVMLRSTQRTELDEMFPSHVVNEWLGHSERVADEHYRQVTPEHWEKASNPHHATHPSSARLGASGGGRVRYRLGSNDEKTPGKRGFSRGCGDVTKSIKAPRRGVEPLLPP